MTVGELIESLKKFDPNLKVKRYDADNVTYEDMTELTQEDICEDYYNEKEDGEIWVRRKYRSGPYKGGGELCDKGNKLIKFLGI